MFEVVNNASQEVTFHQISRKTTWERKGLFYITLPGNSPSVGGSKGRNSREASESRDLEEEALEDAAYWLASNPQLAFIYPRYTTNWAFLHRPSIKRLLQTWQSLHLATRHYERFAFYSVPEDSTNSSF